VITAGQLAYFAKPKGSVKPTGPAHTFKLGKDRIALLWGDPVFVISLQGGVATVSAKGHHLELPVAHLMEKPLLSLYQIDCGQGDAALVHFPDDRWAMIDGGPDRGGSNSGKIAADFLYWKMFVDQSWKNEFGFRLAPFRIDALVCTHPDADHFGGFDDMTRRVREKTLEYMAVYHCGLGRFAGESSGFANGAGFGQLGPVAASPGTKDVFVTELLDGFNDVDALSQPTLSRQWTLDGAYANWLRDLSALHGAGAGVGPLERVHHGTGHLPGFEPGNAPATVKVLGPVEETFAGKPSLRYLDGLSASALRGPSVTRNGHSIVLRIDYGDVRILLTGDLNFRSQALLLKNVPADEFRCHVAKACHHGSEDIASTFLKAMSPWATMISSGDNEKYAHPRARVLGLTGAFGELRAAGRPIEYLGLREERHVAPLIYSTELSRSIQLFEPFGAFDAAEKRLRGVLVQARGRTPSAERRRERLEDWLLGDRMVYGLINVRTDGKRILIGVMNEGDASFHVEELRVS
jgi:beta-lactamase superfamily II metal-dependent hydrolase